VAGPVEGGQNAVPGRLDQATPQAADQLVGQPVVGVQRRSPTCLARWVEPTMSVNRTVASARPAAAPSSTGGAGADLRRRAGAARAAPAGW
jgi:hypothetical protein